MNLSYWERDFLLGKPDIVVVGAGIVGLNCALQLKELHPTLQITVLERSVLPAGASTKNAGFACFGSITELMDDAAAHGIDQMLALVEDRWSGLHLLKKRLGAKAIDFQNLGGYEMFQTADLMKYPNLSNNMMEFNALLHPIFRAPVFSEASNHITDFGFSGIEKLIFNKFEGQINTGLMMKTLTEKCLSVGIQILTNCMVSAIEEEKDQVILVTSLGNIAAKQVAICTNAFTKKLMPQLDVVPGRAQVLITKPIKDLKIKGTFHYDSGYYYFRNINQRLLIGGGRNTDLAGETTTQFGITSGIQKHLENLINQVVLPNTPYEIDMRWSGIMGLGNSKKVILESTSERISVGVRLGGMGVAIGSDVGNKVANLISNKI